MSAWASDGSDSEVHQESGQPIESLRAPEASTFSVSSDTLRLHGPGATQAGGEDVRHRSVCEHRSAYDCKRRARDAFLRPGGGISGSERTIKMNADGNSMGGHSILTWPSRVL